MGADESSIAVEEAALLIAAHLRPGLVVEDWLSRIDEIAAGCADDSLVSICEHVFGDLGFVGNSCAYYDPGNSCLDVVIEGRTGIPITLSVLLMAVARRLGRSIVGIGFPGHFLVRDVETGFYVDAFDGGTILDVDGCRALHRQLHGPDVPFDDRWLEPVGPRAIVRRMLNNLVSISIAEKDMSSRLAATRLRGLLPDASTSERADVANALAAAGEFMRAAFVLEAVAADAPAAEAKGLRFAAADLRSRLN